MTVVVKRLRSKMDTTAAPAYCTPGRIAGSVEFVVQFPDSTIPGIQYEHSTGVHSTHIPCDAGKPFCDKAWQRYTTASKTSHGSVMAFQCTPRLPWHAMALHTVGVAMARAMVLA